MARQLNATCNFNMGYLICDIPDNTIEVVVKIKTMFGKHTLVKDRERRMVKYRLWQKCNQPHIRMEMAKRVAPLRFRKVRKEGTDSGSSSDSGTWINMGEGFGYPPTTLIPTTPRPVKKEEKNLMPHLKHTPKTTQTKMLHPMTLTAHPSLCWRRKHPLWTNSKLTQTPIVQFVPQ